MNRLIVIGAGGHGRVVADAAETSDAWSSICFLDQRFPGLQRVDSWPVVGRPEDLSALEWSADDEFIVGIGNAMTRLALIDQLSLLGLPLATVIHSSAIVSRRAHVGRGSVILANATVNIGARIGQGAILNTASSVDHDCVLADGVHICPGSRLAGDVTVGRCSWIGIGASVRQGISIGADVMVGAGAAVVANLPDRTQAIGVPAKARAGSL